MLEKPKEETFNPSVDKGDYVVRILLNGEVKKQIFAKNATIQVMRVDKDAGLITTIQ